MFARMATFTLSDPSRVADMSERIRAAAEPITRELPGWQGAAQMLDRDGGKMVVIHYFDTEENMSAAESTFEDMPQRFDESLREEIRRIAGGRQSVDRFEVLGEARVGG